MKVYVLRRTDGYDMNEVVVASTDPTDALAVIETDPPTIEDRYELDEWENGKLVENTTFDIDL